MHSDDADMQSVSVTLRPGPNPDRSKLQKVANHWGKVRLQCFAPVRHRRVGEMVLRQHRETRRGLSIHLHFWVGGQCDESRHHSLSYQRLIHPLDQQLIGLDRASRDVTEVGGALGQERATPAINRENRKNKMQTEKGGKETKHKKIGRK